MIIQKWSARIDAMRFDEFVRALDALNAAYQQHGRIPWSRLHHELFGGHQVMMEREFSSLSDLETDESKGALPDIRAAKKALLASVVPGTVEVVVFQKVKTHHS